MENLCRLMKLNASSSLSSHAALTSPCSFLSTPVTALPVALSVAPLTSRSDLSSSEAAAQFLATTSVGPDYQTLGSILQSLCHFCKRNGERRSVFTSHSLKDKHGTVTCPILRRYICPICGATGDDAHTVGYCPSGRGIATISAARTLRKSCGCIRNCRHGDQRHH